MSQHARKRHQKDPDGTVWALRDYELIRGNLDTLAGGPDAREQASRWNPGHDYGVRFRIPGQLGTGAWDIIIINEDLILMKGSGEYHSDHNMIANEHMVKVRILLKGELRSVSGDISLDGAGAFIEAYPNKTSSEYLISGDAPFRMLILHCTPDYFTKKLHLEAEALPPPLNQVFAAEGSKSKAGVAPLGPDILRAANDIMLGANRFPPLLRRQYLSAKSQELICSVINDLSNASKNKAPMSHIAVREVGRVHEARDLIADQFQKPPSIPKLARLVGLNQTKLKSLFKATFGTTINDFTQKCRMDRAAELLTSSDIGVAEVAYAVGYEYPANFSNAFKRYFGHTPRQLRRAALGEGSASKEEAEST